MPPLGSPLAFTLGTFDEEDAPSYARQLKQLLPPGRLWKLLGDSWLGDFLLGAADELSRIGFRARDMLRELDPTTTYELVELFEGVLGITVDTARALASRQASVVAKLVHRQRFRPADFRQALAPILSAQPADLQVIERTAAQALAMGDAREIYRFFVYRNPASPAWVIPAGEDPIAEANAVIVDIKPSHTLGEVITSINFLCDDPNSLCDRDILGA